MKDCVDKSMGIVTLSADALAKIKPTMPQCVYFQRNKKRRRSREIRDERSRGIEIRIADAFAMIKPTAPFKLAKNTQI